MDLESFETIDIKIEEGVEVKDGGQVEYWKIEEEKIKPKVRKLTKKLLPELEDNVYHFGIGEDYAIIKYAKYLIASKFCGALDKIA
jgi:hypothetical protein